MPSRPQFRELEKELLSGSIAPAYVARTVLELGDHFEDLFQAALDDGLPEELAEQRANELLGNTSVIAAEILRHCELKCWSARHPVAAACGRTLATAAAAPTIPVAYCFVHSNDILRWGASVCLALLITLGFLLGLDSLVPLR